MEGSSVYLHRNYKMSHKSSQIKKDIPGKHTETSMKCIICCCHVLFSVSYLGNKGQ